MKYHYLFLAVLVFSVHGLHTFFGVQPSIGDRDIQLRISRIVVLYSGWIIGKYLYRLYKKA